MSVPSVRVRAQARSALELAVLVFLPSRAGRGPRGPHHEDGAPPRARRESRTPLRRSDAARGAPVDHATTEAVELAVM